MSDSPTSLINRSELFSRCLNDTAFMHQMLRVFQESAPPLVRELKKASDAANWADAKRHAHTLKGSAANLAIEQLRLLALSAEECAAATNSARMAEVIGQIEAMLQRALADAEAILHRPSA